MRQDTTVELCVTDPKKIYNPVTGNYEVGSRISDTVLANVNDLGTERKNMLFGTLDINAKTIRFNSIPEVTFDYVTIDGVDYSIINKRSLRRKMTLVVSERP